MDGVDVAASLATHAVVVPASFWLGGEDVVSFKLGTRRADHRVVEDLFLHIEAIALLVHDPASNHVV